MNHCHVKSQACSKLPATGISQIPEDTDNSFQRTGSGEELSLFPVKGPKHTDTSKLSQPSFKKCNPQVMKSNGYF